MRKSHSSLLLCLLLATGPALAEDTAELDGATPIATVNGTAYSLDMFRAFYFELLQQNRGENPQAIQQQAFDEFMNLIVAAQEAGRRQLETQPQVVTNIELQRLRVMANAALAAMAGELQPADDELKAAYERIKATAARTEYKARHILVADEEEARKLIKQLDKKADFAELAKKHSLGPTGKNGGELDWFDAGQMVAPFVEAVAAMEVGSYSKQPVQTQFGWHIIHLQDSRKVDPPAFDEVKPQILAMVQRQKLGEKLAEMRNAALVDLNEEIVKITPAEPDAAAAAPAAAPPAEESKKK